MALLQHWTDEDQVLSKEEEVAYRVLAGLRRGLYAEWLKLPEGDHLKEAYRDLVWTLDDTDLAGLTGVPMSELPEGLLKGDEDDKTNPEEEKNV